MIPKPRHPAGLPGQTISRGIGGLENILFCGRGWDGGFNSGFLICVRSVEGDSFDDGRLCLPLASASPKLACLWLCAGETKVLKHFWGELRDEAGLLAIATSTSSSASDIMVFFWLVRLAHNQAYGMNISTGSEIS